MGLIAGHKGQLDHKKAEVILHLVTLELISATKANGTFHNTHEGWAVLWEEVEELWDEVREKFPSQEKQLKEAIQSAAMAVRFVHDLIDDFTLAVFREENAPHFISQLGGPPEGAKFLPGSREAAEYLGTSYWRDSQGNTHWLDGREEHRA